MTAYNVTVTGAAGPFTCTATPPARSCDVSGLTRGGQYEVKVEVVNGVGSSTDPPTPARQPNVPAAPVITAAVAVTMDDSAGFEVTWSAGASNGAPITGYQVTATLLSAMGAAALTVTSVGPASTDDTQFTCTSSSTECVMFAPGSIRNYMFVVVADNMAGTSAASTPFVVPNPTPPGPGPQPTPPVPPGPQPVPGPVPPGAVVVDVDGRPDEAASGGPNTDANGIDVVAPGFGFQVSAINRAGQPVALRDGKTLSAFRGQQIRVQGEGLRPITYAAGYLIPVPPATGNPRRIGTTLVSGSGAFTGSWVVPFTITPGTYVLQVVGTLATGGLVSVNMGVIVESVDRRSIIITGQRGQGDNANRVRVSGRTLDLNDAVVTARVKLQGESQYSSGSKRTIEDGRFTWQRKTAKKVYVYFQSEGVRSNRVVIPRR